MISFNLLFSTNIILEIDHLLLPPACYYASAMPASIRPTARVCNNVHKSDKRPDEDMLREEEYTPVCILFRACASMCACASVCGHVCMRGGMYQCSGLHAYEHV